MVSRNTLGTSWIACIVILAMQLSPATATGAEFDDVTFTGRVVDDGRRPVEGARVRLVVSAGMRLDDDVLDEELTNERGDFQLTLPGSWRRQPMQIRQEVAVVASLGERWGTVTWYRTSLPETSGLQVQINANAGTTVRLLAPDGNPLANAAVRVLLALSDTIYNGIDEESAEAIANQFGVSAQVTEAGYLIPGSHLVNARHLPPIFGTTDADGHVTLPHITASRLGAVEVTSAKYGKQVISRNPYTRSAPTNWPSTIRLVATGTLEGRLQSDRPELVRNCPLTVDARGSHDDSGVMVGSLAESVTDSEGRFRVNHLVAGHLTFAASLPDSAYGIQLPERLGIDADKTTSIDVPVVRNVKVRGRIVDAISKQRVPQGTVIRLSVNGFETISCDEAGGFELDAPPGPIHFMIAAIPGYSLPAQPAQLATVPEGDAFQLPDIELNPLAAIRGTVVDPAGIAIRHAEVKATWTGYDFRFGAERIQHVRVNTNEDGGFTLQDVDSRSDLRLTAIAGDYARVLTLGQDELQQPIKVILSDDGQRMLVGRVVDDAGVPVPGARIQVFHRMQDERGNWSAASDVWQDGDHLLATDATGQFKSPPVDLVGQYQLVVRGSGLVTLRTNWIDVTRTDAHDVGTIVVAHVQGAVGRVTNSQGQPIPGATVRWQGLESSVETLTDDDGEFRIPITEQSDGLLTVDQDAYRFFGTWLKQVPETLTIRLQGTGEPGAEEPMTTRWPMTYDQRRALARELAAPLKEQLQAAHDAPMNELIPQAQTVASAFPEFIPSFLEQHPDLDGYLKAMLRREAYVRAPANERPRPGVFLDAMGQGYIGVFSYRDVLRNIDNPDEKLKYLAEAMVLARNIEEPDFRVLAFGMIGEMLLDLGQKEDGAAILREAEVVAKQLPSAGWSGYAKAAFAEELSQIDAVAALSLIEGLVDENEHVRHHGNVAHELAAIDPEKAELALNSIRSPEPDSFDRRSQYACRVAYRMVAVDPERARRIALAVDDVGSRAYALGCIAMGVLANDRAHAAQLLAEAMQTMEHNRDASKTSIRQWVEPAAVAALLVTFAEQIDPQFAREYFWRAMTFMPRVETSVDGAMIVHPTPSLTNLAVLAIRYHPEAALPLWQRATSRPGSSSSDLFLVHLLMDPQAALASLPAHPGMRSQYVRRAVSMLTRDDASFWNFQYEVARLWRIDVEDIDQ